MGITLSREGERQKVTCRNERVNEVERETAVEDARQFLEILSNFAASSASATSSSANRFARYSFAGSWARALAQDDMCDGVGARYVLGAPVSERWQIETSQQGLRVLYAKTTG